MEAFLKPPHLEEDNIMDDLKSNGINKRRAEEQLFKRYSYFIRVGESKFSLPTEDLFDAYSDTVVAVTHSISHGSFKHRSSLKTFMYEIYHNKCVDLVRKKSTLKNIVHRTESINEMEFLLTDNSVSIIEKLIKQSDFDRVKQKMSYLCKKSRQVLLLTADGYSDKEIAGIIQFKTADVVKSCRLRGIKKLRELVC